MNALAYLASRTTVLGVKPNIELFCVDTSSNGGERIDYNPETARSRVKKAFEAARNYFKEDYESIPKVVGFGTPAEAIVAEAEKINAAMILIGTRGQGVLSGLLFGSVTQKVFALTTRPVMVLRQQNKLPKKIMHVGIAVDGTCFGPTMLGEVFKMLGSYRSYVKFDLLNVVEIPDLPQHRRVTVEEIQSLTEAAYDKNTASAQAVFQKENVPFTKGILSGMNPGDAIVQYANEHQLDLMIMGSHGYSPIQSVLFGSNAMRVASRSQCPMLIFHPSHYPEN